MYLDTLPVQPSTSLTTKRSSLAAFMIRAHFLRLSLKRLLAQQANTPKRKRFPFDAVMSRMCRAICHFQVLDRVITSITVLMVNDLVRAKRSSEMLLHYFSMLQNGSLSAVVIFHRAGEIALQIEPV